MVTYYAIKYYHYKLVHVINSSSIYLSKYSCWKSAGNCCQPPNLKK